MQPVVTGAIAMAGSNRKRARRTASVAMLAQGYKRWVSPGFHALGGSLFPMRGGCRYLPTCSEYAAVAIARYGWLQGTALAAWRILRCHPWSRGGFDPVPSEDSVAHRS